MRLCVRVGSADYPGRAVRNGKIKDLALLHNVVKAVHDLLDGRGLIPVVEVQDINPVCLKLRQRVSEADVKTSLVVPTGVDGVTLPILVGLVICPVTVLPQGHPLAEPGFRLFVLVVVRSVYEIAASLNIGIEQLERLLLVHAAHTVSPCAANGHGTEAQGGDPNTRSWGKDSEAAELRGRLWCGTPSRHGVVSLEVWEQSAKL
ncbi:unnamed protein product [Clonostachys rosea]|uniref:Uncharacterized protein n=1 Tax=Bionectria ochroleuca TaxID=29856 RepID=A0ABY6U395_BIOOC|nr:unnamed protein product [Clonostachys rosea]